MDLLTLQLARLTGALQQSHKDMTCAVMCWAETPGGGGGGDAAADSGVDIIQLPAGLEVRVTWTEIAHLS